MRNSDRWLGLEMRHLMALRAVAEEGTFARAAVELGYTQSAVSQQIAALEGIVGRRLVDRPRGHKPIGLTEVGQLVLRHGEAILARMKAAQADLSELDATDRRPLRIGTYQSIGLRILPTLLPRFAAVVPDVALQLRESASDCELLALIEQGELDLAFCMLPTVEGPFEAIELLSDPWVLVVPIDSPLASQKRPPSLKQIAAQPLICYRTCPTSHRVETLLRRRGVEPTIGFSSDDNATLQAMVRAGLGVAFMPRLAVDEHDPQTATVDVGSKLPPRLIGIVWHRDRYRPSALLAFVEATRGVCSELEAQLTGLPDHLDSEPALRLGVASEQTVATKPSFSSTTTRRVSGVRTGT
jgi:DNA-binding transcriptional LysR family regulator